MIILITFLSLLIFLIIGVPIAIALGMAGITGIILLGDMSHTLPNLANLAFNVMFNHTLLAIPMFILMGDLLTSHKVGSDMYDAVYKWIGHMRGGLAAASAIMGALFGFISGSSTAGAAVLGGVSIPEMVKRNYEMKFSLGTLACAVTLAILIPPSNGMIIYAFLAEASLGKLFIGGIIPGLMLTALMVSYILIRARVQPTLAPEGPVQSLKVKIAALITVIPVILLFLTVLGGIYAGLWSAVEAGAAGAIVAFIIVSAQKRVSLESLRKTALNSAELVVMVFMIVIGGTIFVYFTELSGFSKLILELVQNLKMPPWGVFVIMGMIMTGMGCFVEGIALMLLTVPIFLPVVVSLGYDPVWYGIMQILLGEMSLITPPVGMNLFVIKGVAPKGTTLGDVSHGAAPYVLIIWIMIILIIRWPEIVLWLPSTMLGK